MYSNRICYGMGCWPPLLLVSVPTIDKSNFGEDALDPASQKRELSELASVSLYGGD